MSVQSTYQSLKLKKPDDYLEVQKLYGPIIQKGLVTLIEYNTMGKTESWSNT